MNYTRTMQSIFIITGIAILFVGCVGNLQSENTDPKVTAQVSSVFLASDNINWTIYDPDPEHLWNRVFRQFYKRVAKDGKQYGMDELDPLLWADTTYLLAGDSHEQALQILDEFLTTNAETLIRDPLKRAIFQRDLWTVFDWLAFQAEPYPSQREELKVRLTKIIRRIALTKDEISSLPDNYRSAIELKIFPADFQADRSQAAFLPFDLFQPGSAWIPMGREAGPIAISHTNEFPFFGRSVFLVFIRSPDGRNATLDFIDSLNKDPRSVLTMGLDIALVRRILLIDDQGELVLSPLIETVQIRHFNEAQVVIEWKQNHNTWQALKTFWKQENP